MKNAQRGAALIEFAIVVPLLMMLLVGLIEVGRFMYFAILVGNAARAGVQWGAIDRRTAVDSSGMQTAALNDGQGISGLSVPLSSANALCYCYNGTSQTSISCTNASVETVCPSGWHRQIYVTLTANGTFHALFNYGGIGLPSSITVTRTATMQVANAQ
jgi:Flp pilus assembly protein TadG